MEVGSWLATLLPRLAASGLLSFGTAYFCSLGFTRQKYYARPLSLRSRFDVDLSKRCGEPQKQDLFNITEYKYKLKALKQIASLPNNQIESFFSANQSTLDNPNLIV
jgi:hypothetical protein